MKTQTKRVNLKRGKHIWSTFRIPFCVSYTFLLLHHCFSDLLLSLLLLLVLELLAQVVQFNTLAQGFSPHLQHKHTEYFLTIWITVCCLPELAFLSDVCTRYAQSYPFRVRHLRKGKHWEGNHKRMQHKYMQNNCTIFLMSEKSFP